MDNNELQIIVCQLGARRHYAVPLILHRAGMLAHFFTDAYTGKGTGWKFIEKINSKLPKDIQPVQLQRLLGRRVDGLPSEKITAFNLLGLFYTLAQKWGGIEGREQVFETYGQRFCKLVCRHPWPQADILYAMQGAALPLFVRAREEGMLGILDKFSAPAEIDLQLVQEEKALWPGWEIPLPPRRQWQRRIELERQEWQTADAVICGSRFVANGLISLGLPPERVQVVPSGYDASNLKPAKPRYDGSRPLRILFVGSVALRKGVQYIYQALEKLNTQQVEARLVGPVAIQEPHRSRLASALQLTGQVPRSEVGNHYAWADIFIFPSICEGSAMVTYEALAAGLPVITTPNAGSVVRDGIDGYIIPIRDSAALAEKIQTLLADWQLLQWMGENARQRAKEFDWDRYGQRLVAAVKKVCNPL